MVNIAALSASSVRFAAQARKPKDKLVVGPDPTDPTKTVMGFTFQEAPSLPRLKRMLARAFNLQPHEIELRGPVTISLDTSFKPNVGQARRSLRRSLPHTDVNLLVRRRPEEAESGPLDLKALARRVGLNPRRLAPLGRLAIRPDGIVYGIPDATVFLTKTAPQAILALIQQKPWVGQALEKWGKKTQLPSVVEAFTVSKNQTRA